MKRMLLVYGLWLIFAAGMLGMASCCGPWAEVGKEIYSDQCKIGAERCAAGMPQVCSRGGSGKSPSPFAEWHNLEPCASGKVCRVKSSKARCLAH